MPRSSTRAGKRERGAWPMAQWSAYAGDEPRESQQELNALEVVAQVHDEVEVGHHAVEHIGEGVDGSAHAQAKKGVSRDEKVPMSTMKVNGQPETPEAAEEGGSLNECTIHRDPHRPRPLARSR